MAPIPIMAQFTTLLSSPPTTGTSDRAPRQAVILAAGVGSRLGKAAAGLPKCLQPLGDHTLLELQIDIFKSLGVEEICVVVGYRSELIRRVVARYPGCTTVENVRYAETNSLYSLWVAREWIKGAFACINADVVAHPELFRRVLCAGVSALGCDYASGDEDEHMKIDAREGWVRGMSKKLSAARVVGENVGLLSFDAAGAAAMLAAVERMVAEGQDRSWVPAAVDRITSSGVARVRAVDVTGLPWTEVDFPEDLENARLRVWPRLAREVPSSFALSGQAAQQAV